MKHTYDVVIVGGRCGGAALARLVAGSGLRTLVIDRASFPSDTVSTHSITAHGTELLSQWGLLDEIRAAGTPNPDSARFTVGAFSAQVARPRGFLAPRRHVVDTILVDSARRAGADVWESTAFDSLVHRGEAVAGLRVRRPDGTTVTVAGRVVVGADGAHSAVADALGVPSYRIRPSALSGLYGYYEGTDLGFELALGGQEMALAIPTSHGRVCIALAGHDRHFPALHRGGDEAAAALAGRVRPEIADGMKAGHRVGRWTVMRAKPGRYRQAAGAGWALVGDAGHYTDPFTAQGMANAYLGAHLLADALIDGLGGARPLESALAAYGAERDELTAAMHEVTHTLAAMAWSDQEALDLLLQYRDLGEQLRQYVAGMLPREPVTSGAAHTGQRAASSR